MNVILEAKDIVKTYGYEDNKVYATNHIDLQIEEGSFVAIVGRSGSGKKYTSSYLGRFSKTNKRRSLFKKESLFMK